MFDERHPTGRVQVRTSSSTPVGTLSGQPGQVPAPGRLQGGWAHTLRLLSLWPLGRDGRYCCLRAASTLSVGTLHLLGRGL